jgi:hypothetical protein
MPQKARNLQSHRCDDLKYNILISVRLILKCSAACQRRVKPVVVLQSMPTIECAFRLFCCEVMMAGRTDLSETLIHEEIRIHTHTHTLSLWIYSLLLDLGRFFSFLIYTQSEGLLGRRISLSQGRYLHTEQHKHRINTQTSMHRVRFEPTIPALERTKRVNALDRGATRIGIRFTQGIQL